MRREQIKPKVARSVSIPKPLANFFGYVHTLIVAGDDIATRASDDLIQGRRVYGGLVEEGRDCFAFTYFPGSHIHPRWQIEVTARETADVASGDMKSLELWECTNPECQYLFASSGDVCMNCDYQDDERDARDAFLPSLANSRNRAEWVRGYIGHFPDDHPIAIIGEYNGQPGLGERLGWFTTQEMQSLIAEAKQSIERGL